MFLHVIVQAIVIVNCVCNQCGIESGKSNDTPIEAYNCSSVNPSLFVDASVVVDLHFTGQQGGVLLGHETISCFSQLVGFKARRLRFLSFSTKLSATVILMQG